MKKIVLPAVALFVASPAFAAGEATSAISGIGSEAATVTAIVAAVLTVGVGLSLTFFGKRKGGQAIGEARSKN